MDDERGSAAAAATEPHPVGVTLVARAARFTALAQVVSQGVRFAANIVLARLLIPADFGVVAIALVVVAFLDQLRDLGTGSALIQRPNVDQVLRNSVFVLNLAMGLTLAGGMYVLSGPLAGVLGNPEAAPVLHAFAGIAVVSSLGQIHHSLLRRDLRFGELAVSTTASAVVTAAVSITGAAFGLSYWALVLGVAAGECVDTALVWYFDRWRPTRSISLASLRSIWGYSRNLFMSNMLFFFFNQVDKIIISRFLGAAPLGLYTMAKSTALAPVSSVSSVVAEVTFPAFSRRQSDNAALRTGYLRSSQVVALVTFPALFGLAAVAEPLIHVLLGERWAAAVPIVVWLAPAAAVQSVVSSSAQLMLAKGRSDWSYRWGLVYTVVLTGLTLVAVEWGIVAVAAAYTVGNLVLAPFGLMLAFHLIEMRLRDFVRGLLAHVLITGVMAGAVVGATTLLGNAGASYLVELLVGVGVGVLVYGGLLLLVKPQGLSEATTLVRRKVHR
ncbi:lipopolysaccharide biosynthesis protein [Phycicoccus sp. HDW14]|uniref:lipopolysaccharide biosynthesis protein n=1 Tax=Phycicoccus sp. HDW14 TaxID=2714941 RepID=UPI00140A0A88|nr:lipopolysaccharide biosynthesis protein [Phycicoccus sp. HDW14]QIM21708.1 lipopolysaccharide biosynthesis protein [Phycicoccus sp. HDW14]